MDQTDAFLATTLPRLHYAETVLAQRRRQATDGDVVARRARHLVRRGRGRDRLGGDRTDLPPPRRSVLPVPLVPRRGRRRGSRATTSPTQSPTSTRPPPIDGEPTPSYVLRVTTVFHREAASGRWCTVTRTRRDHRLPATSSTNSHPAPTARVADRREGHRAPPSWRPDRTTDNSRRVARG